MRRYLAAVVQMDTSPGWEANLCAAEHFIEEAADAGAQLVVFPENFSRYEHHTPSESLNDSPTLRRMGAKAAERKIWVLCGSILTPAPDGRSYSSSLLLNPDGVLAARYDKLHLFDVSLPNGDRHFESKHLCPGDHMTVTDTPLGKLGLSICYDVRFPALYRAMALGGAEVLMIPAMFSAETGRAHWEPLIRARAIETGCYVLAADQWAGKFGAWGHSMIVDPWGQILCEIPDGQGMALAEIDLDEEARVRRDIACLSQQRTDIYGP